MFAFQPVSLFLELYTLFSCCFFNDELYVSCITLLTTVAPHTQKGVLQDAKGISGLQSLVRKQVTAKMSEKYFKETSTE